MKKWILFACVLAIISFSSCGSNKESSSKFVGSSNENENFNATIIEQELPTEKIMSDIEILTLKGHPTLYGSTETAHDLWDKYSSEDTIVFKNAIGHHKKYDNAYLILDCYTGGGAYSYSDSEYIEGIKVNFLNLKETSNITFDNALDITKSYLPIDFMSEKYDFFESCCQDIGSKENPMLQYSIIYKIKDEFLSEARNNDIFYDIWISIVIRTDKNNNATYLSITENRVADSRNEPEKQEWNYDFITQ